MHPWADAVELHRRVASIPGDVSLWPNLSGGEAIDLLSRLRGGGVDHAAFKERKHHLCELFDFDPGKKGRAYSKGNRQKVALISALVMDAELYLLDEPTSGLDPLMEAVFTREIRRIVHENAGEAEALGAAIFFMSCAELWGYKHGEEWLVSHYLFKKP